MSNNTISTKLRYFENNNQKIEILNRLIATNSTLMAHQLASALGCEIEVAVSILLVFHIRAVAKAKLNIYHSHENEDPPSPVLIQDIEIGFPALPFYCPSCEEKIIVIDDLSFDLMFELLDNFTVGN